MKNKEKYAKEIIEIAAKGHAIALDKREMKLCACDELYCNNCYFHANGGSCKVNIRRWADTEAVLTQEEKVKKLKEYCERLNCIDCVFSGCPCHFDMMYLMDKKLGTNIIDKMYEAVMGGDKNEEQR